MKVRSQDTISIGRSLYQKMLEDVKLRAPEEACGIVAGRNNLPSHVYVIENELHSQVAFRMDPQQQVIAFLEMEKQDLEMLAIYHSHPTGPIVPSETDLAEFAYPGVLSLIWFTENNTWNCRAFLIANRSYTQVGLQVVENE